MSNLVKNSCNLLKKYRYLKLNYEQDYALPVQNYLWEVVSFGVIKSVDNLCFQLVSSNILWIFAYYHNA